MMRRGRRGLVSHISTAIVFLLCMRLNVLESRSVNQESNITGARASLVLDADVSSSDTDTYDTSQANDPQNGTEVSRGPPVVTHGDRQTVEVHARENVELKCPVISEPPPLYDWFKGQDRIDSSWERFELSSSRESNTISIRSVKHEDQDDYTCEAVNGFGKGSFTIHLVVTGEDPFKDNYLKSLPQSRRNGVNNNNSSSGGSTAERPEILKAQLPREKSISLAKGSNSTLKCEASGKPRPNITWFKGNVQLGNSKQDVSHLKLISVSENDAGFYKCEATNFYGKSTYEIAVEVEVGSWQVRTKAEIVELTPHNLTLFPGENGSITCVARFENEFQPHIFWVKRVDMVDGIGERAIYYNGSFFDVLNRTDIKKNSKHLYAMDLVLTNVSRVDAGSYHCVVAGRMGYMHSEAHVFIQTDPVQLLNIQLSKERAVTIQWAVFSCFVFLITTVLILACIYKMYSCHRQMKPNFPLTKSRPSSAFPPVSFFRCNNSVSINTTPDKSGGDTTVSTTLSNSNPSQETIQPLVTDNSGAISRSSSPALSLGASSWVKYDTNRRRHNSRDGSHHRHEHSHRHHHHQLVKPPLAVPIDGVGNFSDINDASHELHKLYNSSLNQIYCDECSESDGPTTPITEFPDFGVKDSVSTYLSRSRNSSQSLFRKASSKEGSVASGKWSYTSARNQTENLNNSANNNDLLVDTDLTMCLPHSVDGPKYVYPEHQHLVNLPGCDQRPEVFHDKNLNSCYYLNKNINEFPEFIAQNAKVNKRKRRAQTHHKSRYHQPPSSPVSFYSNASIIV